MSQPSSTQPAKNKDQETPRKKQLRTCEVISLERSSGPEGAPGNDWYRYVISMSGSPITGYRRGKISDVREYLKECTKKLDERLNSGKWPRAASGRKPNQAKASG